jgi:hypothetical protein
MALLPLLRHDHDIGPGAGPSPAALVEGASVDVTAEDWRNCDALGGVADRSAQ